MQIDEHVRIPLVEHRQRSACLRRLSLYIITIEIESLRIGTHTDHLGSILLPTIQFLPGELFVAIRVVVRHCDQNNRIEGVRLR